MARWLDLPVDPAAIGPQPHRVRHLDALSDTDVESAIARVEGEEDRGWLLLRLDQARTLARTIDWDSSPLRLIHGDLASHNLLWERSELTGVIDFELATVERRVVELVNVWRCRHDDVLLAFDALAPMQEQEWRMLLVDWWAQLISLAVHHLRLGGQPGRWELDGLRRTSPIASRLEHDLGLR